MQNQFEWDGFTDANGKYQPTDFYRACKNAAGGKKTILLLDEIDCCDSQALKHYNDCFERKWYTFPNGEKLDFSKNLVFIGAANTFGTGADSQYIGNQLDASTLNRFVSKYINYDIEVEKVLTNNNSTMITFFHQLRKSAEMCHMDFIASYRSMKMITIMEGAGDLKEILVDCLFKGTSQDDIQALLNNMEYNKYTEAMGKKKQKEEQAA
jgi:hypothetical protein